MLNAQKSTEHYAEYRKQLQLKEPLIKGYYSKTHIQLNLFFSLFKTQSLKSMIRPKDNAFFGMVYIWFGALITQFILVIVLIK